MPPGIGRDKPSGRPVRQPPSGARVDETKWSSVLRILSAVDKLMFNDGELRLALEAQTRKMVAAVDGEPEEILEQADLDEWTAALAHHFAVACPELTTDAVWMEPPGAVGADVSRDPMRAIMDPYSDAVRNYPGYRIIVHLPFEGDGDVFKLRPSSFTLNPPRTRIARDELLLTIEDPHDGGRRRCICRRGCRHGPGLRCCPRDS